MSERRTSSLRAGDVEVGTIALVGDRFFTSGVSGHDANSGQLPVEPEAQFARAFSNLGLLLAEAGVSLENVGQLTVFIPDASYRPYINPPWLTAFPDGGDRPARKTTHVPLPGGTLVELQAFGVVGARRTPIEIPGLAHRDPLPMGARIGDLVFSSVLGGDDPATGQRAEGVAQIRQMFTNGAALVELAGGSADNIGIMWVYLGDMAAQPAMIDAWLDAFPADGDRPCRKTFAYDLGGRTTLAQAQLVAVLDSKRTNYELEGIGHHDPIPLAARVGDMLFTSGISGPDRERSQLRPDAYTQAQRAIETASAAAWAAGLGIGRIGHVTALVEGLEHEPDVRRAWREAFPDHQDAPALTLLNLGVAGRDSLVQLHLIGVA